MKRINLVEHPVDTTTLLALAQDGPVVLLAPNGKEYVLAAADDFDLELMIRAFGQSSSARAVVPWRYDTTRTDHYDRAGQ